MNILAGFTNIFEEMGRQISFYLRILGDLATFQVIRRRYTSIVFAMMSDIAIGARALTGLIGSFANTREVTPLIAGVAFAAQVGAGFTAELGAMRISDEIDALEVMGVPSFVYLVSTRVIAAFLCIIPLYLFSLYASFFATQIVTTRFFGLSPGVYN